MKTPVEIASLAVDDLLSEFLAPMPSLPAKKTKKVPDKPEPVKVAEAAVDDLLGEFELGAADVKEVKVSAPMQLEFVTDDDDDGHGGGEGDENQNKLNVGGAGGLDGRVRVGPQHVQLEKQQMENKIKKPKTPPSKSKKVKGGRRPKYRPAAAPTNTASGSSIGSGETEVTEVVGLSELGGSLLEETEVIRPPPPVKNSRYLREVRPRPRDEAPGSIVSI